MVRVRNLRMLGIAAVALFLGSCASVDEILVNKEEGFFYGSALGATEAEAGAAALEDLVYRVFVESGSIDTVAKNRFVASDEMKTHIASFALKPFSTEEKDDGRFAVVYRLDEKDWTKQETTRRAGILAGLQPRLAMLDATINSATARTVKDAVAAARSLEKQGLTLGLRRDGKTQPLYREFLAFIDAQIRAIKVEVSPNSGIVEDRAVIKVVATLHQLPLQDFPVLVTWTNAQGKKLESNLVTNAQGIVELALPTGDEWTNQNLGLTVAVAASKLDATLQPLQAMDRHISVSANLRHTASLGTSVADEVVFAAGNYTIGAQKQDSRAGSVEKARPATVQGFAIQRNLVTNQQYQIYLDAIKASFVDYPDSLSDPDLQGPDQPVLGLSYEEAMAYARWLSQRTGKTWRLPTEAEYEVAARAGQAVVYPWGDQRPDANGVIRANYAGNGRFKATSPVGSFPDGRNSQGLNDMVGNVWQWTSTPNNGSMSGAATWLVVKGGSYLDGPVDLRISNRVIKDPAERHPDVGFRLVREL